MQKSRNAPCVRMETNGHEARKKIAEVAFCIEEASHRTTGIHRFHD